VANTYDTLRGRARTQTVGVSEKMMRVRDAVISTLPPALSVPAVPTGGIKLEVQFINPMSVLEFTPGWNYPDTGILSWNNGGIYKCSNLMESFRQRYTKSFAVTNRRLTFLG
jgi:hypothetical protein